MYNHSSKKQVEYSLTQLTGGLFYCLRKKKLEDITVTDICKKAGVTRRTYYRNCDSKTDLVLYGTDRLVTELLQNTDFESNNGRQMYQTFFSFWNEHREFLTLIDQNNLFDFFLIEFTKICFDMMRYPLQEKVLSDVKDQEMVRTYSNAFVIGGLGQMLRQWAKDEFKQTPGELADAVLYLIPGN